MTKHIGLTDESPVLLLKPLSVCALDEPEYAQGVGELPRALYAGGSLHGLAEVNRPWFPR